MKTLQVGEKVPDFSVSDDKGNIHQLSDYKGQKLVVFFYPKASTPSCTAEACDLNANFDRFTSLGYEILGVSADIAKRQSNFKTKTGPYFDRIKKARENKAGGGLLKQAGDRSGAMLESMNPDSQGLQGLLNRVKKT